jgi:hypothetical protein
MKTLKANLDLSNIEIKAEIKQTQRQLDIKILDAFATVNLTLSQNKNNFFNLECSLDQDSEFILNIKRDLVN